MVRLVDGALGTEKLDLHLNRLVSGGPSGSLHRHSPTDNVYIVHRGEARLIVEDAVHMIREGQVVEIRAGT